METKIALPKGRVEHQIPRAYCQLDDGTIWGPLWPYEPVLRIGWNPPGQINSELPTLSDAIAKTCPGWGIGIPTLNAGQYYSRIWRGTDDISRQGETFPKVGNTRFVQSMIASFEQIENLFEGVAAIFRTIHPCTENLDSYGGAIRDSIILSCTEVEAQWKGILTANHYQASGKFFSTKDYVKLLPVMALDKFGIRLLRYPNLGHIFPFKDWNATKPTESLAWYNAYNAVKHDRENNYSKATLRHAIGAVAACVIMLAAQFGTEELENYGLGKQFYVTHIPQWDPEDWYYEPVPGREWIEVDFPFP